MGTGVTALKSYLVSLGFGIDSPSYEKFKRSLDDTTGKVAAHTAGMTKSYVVAASAIASALASVGFFTAGLMGKVAEADMEYQLFASHMFMGKEAAKQMKIATDALGHSIDDISWNPELRAQYHELIRLEKRMEQPKDAQQQLKQIRDIQFEFTKLKVEATYGLQWIGYHLGKHLAGPIQSITEGLRKLNEFLVAKMPEWSDKFARVLVTILNVGGAAWRVIKEIFTGLKEIWDMMPDWAKAVAIALGVALAPISPALKIIAGLLLLLDDFYAYIDGRKSSKYLAPVWHALVMATDTIVRSLVAAMVLIDGIFSDKSWSEVFKETQDAWNTVEGTTKVEKKPYEGKYRIENIPTMLGDLPKGGAVNRLQSGVDNYQSMAMGSTSPLPIGGGSNVNVNVGDIKVEVAQTDAKPNDIAIAVQTKMKDILKSTLSRNTREAAGVF